MKRIISILLLIAVLLSTIILTSCDVAKIILGVFDLVKEDNTEIDLDFNFGNIVHVHKESIIPAIESTCFEHGKTEGRYCLECEKIIVPQEEAPLKAHTYDNNDDPSCNVCGYQRDILCFHMNKEKISGKNATCTETGLTEGLRCLDCGEILIAQKGISLKEHTPSDWIIDYDSTTTQEGLKHVECTVCKIVMYQSVIPIIGAESTDLEYSLNIDGKGYTVTGIGGCKDKNVVIPSSYNGLPVTAIGKKAFYISDMTAVSIPDSVTEIGQQAFAECHYLINVEIPNSVTTIHSRAFESCRKLVNVIIPDSVNEIGSGVFASCYSLVNIEVYENNEHYKSVDGNLYTKDEKTLIQYAVGKKDTSFEVPDSVTTIASGAVKIHGGNLTSLTIPNSVKTIGSSAFYYNSKMEDVYFEGTLEEWLSIDFDTDSSNPMYFGANLYVSGELVTELILPEYITTIPENVFVGCTSISNLTIPNSVTQIDSYAFMKCSSISNFELPKSLQRIGSFSFYDCDNLKSIVIPGSVTYMGIHAFGNCDQLTSVVIESPIKTIEQLAFYENKALTDVTIPNSVTKIDHRSFSECTSLTTIIFEGTMSEWKAIEKADTWDENTGEYIVYCTDGNISK